MAAFVGAGALAGNATVTPQAISSHASTAVGDLLICQLINKSPSSNPVSAPDGTWTRQIEGQNNATTAAHRHQYSVFTKVATLAGAQSYTFTKTTDDNVLFAGVISTWKVPGLDATTRGVTATTAATDNVSFPAFDPTSTSAHVIYFAWYGLNATTFAAMAGTNPTCTICYDLESATGTTCTLAATSGNSTGSAITSRTWASASTTDAGNTGVVLALDLIEIIPVTQATVTVAGKTVAIPADVAPPVPFTWTRSKLDVRQTLIYRPLTVPPRQGPVTDIVPVSKADVVFAGKTVTGIDTGVDVNPVASASVVFTGKTVTSTDISAEVIPVAQATVTYTGQTVSIGEATPPGNNDVSFAATTTSLPVRRSLIYRPLSQTIGPVGPSPGSGDVLFATTRTTRVARRGLLYRSLTAPPLRVVATDTTTVTQATVSVVGKTVTLVDLEIILKATITVAGKTVTVRDADVTPVAKATVTVIGKPLTEFGLVPILKGTVVFAGQTVALVDPGVDRITVEKADVWFTGKTVTVTDTGVQPPVTLPPGGGGVWVPPWIDYGRKHRRRYRALEEIERRIDQRIERLKTETKEKQQQVAEVISQPGQIDVLSQQFANLLLQQALITQALLEAQRRAEAVRQERIQLAILAQRAAEAIDEEEAITMLLLT